MTTARLDAFLQSSGDLCHADWWGEVARIWRAASPQEREDERWAGIWTRASLAPGARENLMTGEERAAYDALPDDERRRTVALFLTPGGEPDPVRTP